MKAAIVILAVLAAGGCANTAPKLNDISVGMSKEQVRQILGDPHETRATAGTEYLIYRLRSGAAGVAGQAACGVGAVFTLGLTYAAEPCRGTVQEYFVLLREGLVHAYGRPGDFDSTKDPTYNINIKNR